MKMIVKYFGAAADVTGRKEETISIETGQTLKEFKVKLEQQYNGLKNINYSIALNQSVVSEDVTVNDKDEIAILPPFAGG